LLAKGCYLDSTMKSATTNQWGLPVVTRNVRDDRSGPDDPVGRWCGAFVDCPEGHLYVGQPDERRDGSLVRRDRMCEIAQARALGLRKPDATERWLESLARGQRVNRHELAEFVVKDSE
jgi:hypothetical protein